MAKCLSSNKRSALREMHSIRTMCKKTEQSQPLTFHPGMAKKSRARNLKQAGEKPDSCTEIYSRENWRVTEKAKENTN